MLLAGKGANSTAVFGTQALLSECQLPSPHSSSFMYNVSAQNIVKIDGIFFPVHSWNYAKPWFPFIFALVKTSPPPKQKFLR